MSPPVCGACGQILSGSFYQEGDRSFCASCGSLRQASAGQRRAVRVLLPGLGGALLGLALYGFMTPRWGAGAGALAAALVAAASLIVGWLRAPAPVDGPRPVGNAMPPPGSGQV
jgi:hypothetical protein